MAAAADKELVQISMVNWKLTAITIYCEAVDDEVTIMVYKDGSVKCTGYGKYGEPRSGIPARRNERLKHQLQCEGLECHRVIQYKDKLFAEETKGEK